VSPAPGPPAQSLPELLLVLAVSLDGRLAPAAGGAAQLGGPGDRRVLEEALAWADAALVGAETLRRHGTTGLIHYPDLLEGRTAAGRPPQPIAIAASRSGVLPPEMPFFRQPLERWLLRAAPAPAGEGAETRSRLPGFTRHLARPTWVEALQEFACLGIGRLAVLGGATLAAALLREQLIEELQLTLCPLLRGGSHTWLPAGVILPPGEPPGLPSRWQLVEQRLLGGGELLLRYRLPPS
jgi:5-amino-6-(5-phosphoribosylamino)uracil reductase